MAQTAEYMPVNSSPAHGSSVTRPRSSSIDSKDSKDSQESNTSAPDGEQVKDGTSSILRRTPSKRSVGSHGSNGSSGENGDSVAKMLHENELCRRRSASVLEVSKERANHRLKEELQKAQLELKLKADECKKLTHVQEQMSEELEELTAKLFEEANKMVQDANIKRMNSEKLLKEANSKIDVLQAEVTALKTLVITSTPSMPNRHLHPQIDIKKEKTTSFIKGHRRSTSHHNFSKDMKAVDITPPPPTKPPVDDRDYDPIYDLGSREVDPVYFEEFKEWRTVSPRLMDLSCGFLRRSVTEDITPCLTFKNKELSQKVNHGVLNNTLTIEPVPERQPFPKKCALTEATRICKFRIRLGDSDPWLFISQQARNRIAAVCDFYTYVRYITQGLVKSEDCDMYWEIMRLRRQMCAARLGLSS